MPKGKKHHKHNIQFNIFLNIQNVKQKFFFFHKLKICYLFFIVNNIVIKMDKWHSVAEANYENNNNKNNILVLFMTYCSVI